MTKDFRKKEIGFNFRDLQQAITKSLEATVEESNPKIIPNAKDFRKELRKDDEPKPEETYNKIKPLIAQRKVSEFVNQAVEKELQKQQKREKEQLREKLIIAYKRMDKNKNLQKELATLEGESFPPAKESRKPVRPVLIISDNIQNEYDKWMVVVPITTEDIKIIEPFEVFIDNTSETGLDYPSKIQFNYPFTVERLREHLGVTSKEIMEQSKKAWQIAFDAEE
ncbi:11106_t:CDS:2 [Diversispora eburnea]|uniref:11106_t:CDS:1 n=1 Tax=Diversispora eburnea TaxID=1213867 RepID=A0A9N9AN81_9GLOM|nr:11106_t:CDS:2 [Diversispora eburnea]